MVEVAAGPVRDGDRPDNSDLRIGGIDGALRWFMKLCGNADKSIRSHQQASESHAQKPFRDQQALLIISGQDFTSASAKSGRVFSDIHRTIINLAAQAA